MALATSIANFYPPILNAAITRAAGDPESALAAYEVARNLIWVLSPFTAMVPNGLMVLARNRASLARYSIYIWTLTAAFTVAAAAIVVVPPARTLVFERLIGLPAPLSSRSVGALAALLPFPALTVWRALSQGLLLRRRSTAGFLQGGIVGLAALGGGLALVAGIAAAGGRIPVPGAIQGAALLLISTLAEGLYLAWRCRDCGFDDPADEVSWNPGWVDMSRFFLPLVLTTWVMAFSRTIINAGLARAPDPAVSLAAFSVACSVVFTFESPVVVIRNTALAFADEPLALQRLPRFTLAVGASMSAVVGLLAATPAIDFALLRLIGVTPAIHRAALAPIAIMAVSLLILGWRQLCYALLMGAQRTATIGTSAVARLLFLAAGLVLGPRLWPALPAAASAAVVYTLGFLLETAITHAAGFPLLRRAAQRAQRGSGRGCGVAVIDSPFGRPVT